MGRIAKHCEYCKQYFHVYPSQSKKRFCSIPCYQAYRAEKKLDQMDYRVQKFKKLTVLSAVGISRAKAERLSGELSGIPGITYHLVATYDQA